MPPRSGTTLDELRARLAALEERVARVEEGRMPPGDGRASATPAASRVERCPGCGLPLRRKDGRCRECGVPLGRPGAPRRERSAARTIRRKR